MVKQQKGEVLVVGFGALINEALEAAELLGRLEIRADVYNLRFIQPLDLDYLVSLFYRYRMVCLVEEGCRCGGIGEQIAAELKRRGGVVPFLHLGFPRSFIPQGSRRELLGVYGLDGRTIAVAVEQALASADRLIPSAPLHT